jgi:hypothetical protein
LDRPQHLQEFPVAIFCVEMESLLSEAEVWSRRIRVTV